MIRPTICSAGTRLRAAEELTAGAAEVATVVVSAKGNPGVGVGELVALRRSVQDARDECAGLERAVAFARNVIALSDSLFPVVILLLIP